MTDEHPDHGAAEPADGSSGSTPVTYPEAGKRRAVKSKKAHTGWPTRYRILAPVLAIMFLCTAAVGAGSAYIYGKIGNIGTLALPDAEGRPDPAPGEELNILLLGEDNEGTIHRADTIMIAHVPADRSGAYLVSIPRDSYVEMYDENNEPQGLDKINASFAYYGAAGTRNTVEQLTGVGINHVAKINWEGFMDLSTAVGGVRVYVPETVVDSSQDVTWEQGWHDIQGPLALQYVRMRSGFESGSGDFGRIDRQQNFLRALMAKTLSNGTVGSPVKLNDVLDAVVDNLETDEEFQENIVDLAVNMADVRTDDLEFVTAPLGGYDDNTPSGSVVLLDEKKSSVLWKALADGDLERYLKRFPDEELAAETEVE